MAEAMAEDDRRQQHWMILRNLSDEISIRNVSLDMLKFALFDFIFIRRNLDDATDALAIFKELDNVGCINPDDVTLLIALFKLLWLDALNEIFSKYKFHIENVDPRDKFTPFRISIVNLSNKLQNDDIKNIGHMYAVRQETHLNPWKLLQYLQDKGEICKDNLMDFMEKTAIKKDFLEWHPAKMLPTATESNRRQQHLLMLQNLSQEIGIRNIDIDMLKLALFDFVLIRRNLDYATDAFDLFMELDNVGYINPDNVELLIASFKLLWLNSLNNEILKYEFQVENVDPKDKFTSFRISVVTLSSKLQNHDIKKIAGLFAVPVEKCPNQWKLLQYLQDKHKLGEENLMDFMEKTGIKKDLLEWNPASMITTATESVKVTLKREKSESSDRGQRYSELARPEDDAQNGLHYLANITRLKERRVHSEYEVKDVFSKLGVSQTRTENSSIIFHISSYDPKALKNLMIMCLNGQLLEKMSEILVIEKYKQQFLSEWTIQIDDDQFSSAVSKLEVKDFFFKSTSRPMDLDVFFKSTSRPMDFGSTSKSTCNPKLPRFTSMASDFMSKFTSRPKLKSSMSMDLGSTSKSTCNPKLPRFTSMASGSTSKSTGNPKLTRSTSIDSVISLLSSLPQVRNELLNLTSTTVATLFKES